MTEITPLDLAWESINALGGAPDGMSPFEAGRISGIAQALQMVEQLGGSDPAPKRVIVYNENKAWEDFREAAYDAWNRKNPT